MTEAKKLRLRGGLVRLPRRVFSGRARQSRHRRPNPANPAKGPGCGLGLHSGIARRRRRGGHRVLARGQPESPGEVLADGPAEAAKRSKRPERP